MKRLSLQIIYINFKTDWDLKLTDFYEDVEVEKVETIFIDEVPYVFIYFWELI